MISVYLRSNLSAQENLAYPASPPQVPKSFHRPPDTRHVKPSASSHFYLNNVIFSDVFDVGSDELGTCELVLEHMLLS